MARPSDPELDRGALERMFPDWEVVRADRDGANRSLCITIRGPRRCVAIQGEITNEYELQDAGAGS